MPSRDVEINLIAHDRTGAGTRSAARNLEQLARKTEKLKTQKIALGDSPAARRAARQASFGGDPSRAGRRFANRFTAAARKVFGRGGQRSGAAFMAGFLKTVTFGQIGQGFARGAIRAAPAAAKAGGILGAAMAGVLVLEITQALSAAVPAALGGLLLTAPIVFLLKKQTEGMKQIKIQDKRVASIKKQIAAAEARDARLSGRKGDSAKSKLARQDHINDLKKTLVAEKNIRAEYTKQAQGLVDLKAKAKSFLTFVSQPVEIPLQRSLKAIGHGFDQLKGPFRALTDALGPALVPLTKGVMRGLVTFVERLKPALPGMVASLEQWGAVMPQITGSVADLLTKISSHPEAVQGFADDFSSALGSLGEGVSVLQNITEQVQNFGTALRGFKTFNAGSEFTNLTGGFRSVGISIAEANLKAKRSLDDLLQSFEAQPGSPFEKWKNLIHQQRLTMEADFAALIAGKQNFDRKMESSGSKLAGFKAAINTLKALKRGVQTALKDPGLSKAKRIRLEIDSHHFDAQLAIKKAQLHAFQNTKSKPKLEADKSRLEATLKQVNADLKKTHNKKVRTKLKADKSQAEAALADVNARLNALSKRSVTVPVHVKITYTGKTTGSRPFGRGLGPNDGPSWTSEGGLSGGGMSRTGGPAPVNVAAPIVNTSVFIDKREVRAVTKSQIIDENRRDTWRARVGRR